MPTGVFKHKSGYKVSEQGRKNMRVPHPNRKPPSGIPYKYKNEEQRKEYSKGWLLKKKFGITLEDYNSILENQNYKCAICENNKSGGMGTFPVDHDHKTGKVRGLLCMKCNTGLGLFLDNEDLLLKAIAYLKKHLT